MNLVIDQGNSCVKAGVFDGNELIETISSYSGQIEDRLMFLLAKYSIQNSIFSSVVDYSQNIIHFLRSQGGLFIELNEDTPIPVKNKYKTPATLGKDRIAAAVAANYLKPETNCLVVDAGTCITYDFVNDKGEYLGGNISAGMNMRFQALNAYAKRLPLLAYAPETPFLGDDTETAIQSGVFNGICFEIDGYISRLKEKYSELSVFLTGGDTIFFENTLKNSIFAHKNLLLTGLNRILNYNLE